MIPSNKKIERMIQVARLYYEEDMTQHLIAQKLGISRPLVSQLLTEAKSCGIVTIHINEIENRETLLRHQLQDRYDLRQVVVVPDGGSQEETDRALAGAAYQVCFHSDFAGKKIGLGCGSLLGLMADLAEAMANRAPGTGLLFPLLGGTPQNDRGLHTNELIRILSEKAGYRGLYLYAPAVFTTESEMKLARTLGPCQDVIQYWDQLDVAILNPADLPDLDVVRDTLVPMPENDPPAGILLGHAYTAQGDLVPLRQNNVLQASIPQLQRAQRTIALLSAGTSARCLAGLLALELVDTLILPTSLAHRLLNN